MVIFNNINLVDDYLDLDEAVDVYSAWVDACEDVNKGRREQKLRERDRQKDLERDTDDEPRRRTAAPVAAQSSRTSFANDGLDAYDEEDEDDDDY